MTSALIGSGVRHELTSFGVGTFLYLAPHSQYGRRVRTLLPAGGLDDGALIISSGDPERSPAAWAPQRADHESKVADELVVWIGERIRRDPQSALHMCDVGREFNRSPAGIGRILRYDLSVNFTSIVRWERLRLAIELIADGANCTDAAHRAGFYDGSHFNRVCRAMFGIPPNLLELGCVRTAASADIATAFGLREVS
ncbi:MAG: AraC family transcriptional regulator [Gordonia sp. (in: high G+C Gram-positive bacteria)]